MSMSRIEGVSKAHSTSAFGAFLSGLNESFAQAKGQITLMIPTPTINEAYGMVVQDESQRAKTVNISGLEIGAAAMAYNSGQGFPSGYKQKAQVLCDYCKLKGHTKDVCYKLVGYPPDYKPKKKTFGRNMAAAHNAKVDYSKGPTDQGSSGIETTRNFFTEQQYKQLLQLLNQNTTPVETAAHAKVTGIPLSLLSKAKQDRWIIDSDATNHMLSSLDFFTDFIEIPKGEGRKVQLPTAETIRITHLGSSSILNGLPIKIVMYVPQFRYNLLSVSQLTRDIGCFIAFFPSWCVFQDICNGKVKGIGKLEEGLYVLYLKQNSNLKLPIGFITFALVINRINSSLWHKILGHIPLDSLKRLPAFHNKTFVDYKEHCPVCPLAKQTRLPFPISNSRCDVFGDLIHADVWGPLKVPTFDGKRYFLTLVNDFSRYTWICLMNTKDESVVVLRHFISLLRNKFSTTPKTLRTDNGGELFHKQLTALLQSEGIVHQSSYPYTPQQNGIVKRRHRYILDTTRALRFQDELPLKFWGECVLIAVYLINRVPSRILSGKLPFELVFHKNVTLDHLMVFGRLTYVANLKRQHKFSPRAVPAIFLGYSLVQKAYDSDSDDLVLPLPHHSITSQDTSSSDLAHQDDLQGTPLHIPTVALTPPYIPLTEDLQGSSTCPDDLLFPDEFPSNPSHHTTVVPFPEVLPSSVADDLTAAKIRKSTRPSRPPIWMNDYVGDLLEEVYMTIPPGFSHTTARQGEHSYSVCRLHKSIYGLKQASRKWNLKLTDALH
ncbi:PREDICTED: uncharacterized protein LOC109234812 [Nicotiana attenuata]|uniref:uncharacterized protein LOC109220594 n=1 Tax=Nicotiana attenuata TaxID=49451 RepID=UPI0009047860|nr:PREDICTED: uncharacterized protein LOC109220594 [Nicotiana attenuata]XP_019256409.1 PREDICTED: uncharacterized protein LOC109234812 [Nicotiana attenuata]